jgi:6-pyruvoyltetrahydropterin/6-carboxytetrahydropterin synthase
MEVVRITKKIKLEMAHALLNYEGDCRNIHGHSYTLEVTLKGRVNSKPHHEEGMIMDFSFLKEIVYSAILKDFDHALVLHDIVPEPLLSSIRSYFPKVTTVPFTPTCERLVAHFYHLLRDSMIDDIELYKLKLWETETSFAEYYSSDN